MQSGIWSEVVKYSQPHPEECRTRAARLEGWPLARSSLLPSFETRASKSAVADFDAFSLPKSGTPDFCVRSSGCGDSFFTRCELKTQKRSQMTRLLTLTV